MQQLDQYITVREAAKQIGISKRGVWMRIYRRKIQVLRIGNIALVRLEDLSGYVPRGKKQGSTQCS